MAFTIKSDTLVPIRIALYKIAIVAIIAIPGFLYCLWTAIFRIGNLRALGLYFRRATWQQALEPALLTGRYVVTITDSVKPDDRLPPYTYKSPMQKTYICHRKIDAVAMKLRYAGVITERK